MASWVGPGTAPVRGACDGGGEVGGGEVGGGEVGGGEVGGAVVGGGEVGGCEVGDGLLCAGLAPAQGVDDGTTLVFPVAAPDEGALELP